MNNNRKLNIGYIAVLPFLLVAVCYEIIPLLQLIGNSFVKKDGVVTLENYIHIFTTPLYQTAILNSVRISLISAIIGLLVAFAAAKAYYDVGEKGQRLFTMLLNMTSNFSGVPLAFAFMLLMGNTGFLTLLGKSLNVSFLADFNIYSGMGLTIIYIYFQIPMATLLLLPTFVGLKKEWSEVAEILNANGFMYWLKIGIPNLLPGILGTLSVLFANALAAYATAYALVLNNYAMLALQISSKFKGDVQIDKQMGGALAVVLILLMVLCTLANNYLTKKNTKGRILV